MQWELASPCNMMSLSEIKRIEKTILNCNDTLITFVPQKIKKDSELKLK